MIFERLDKIDSAQKCYLLANKEYAIALKRHPDDVEIVRGFILLRALTNGKDDAMKEIDRQIKLHPNFQSMLEGDYEYYKVFNRYNYINNLPTEKDDNSH